MAIGNLQRILKERNMNFQEDVEEQLDEKKLLGLMYKYIEENFKKVNEHLEVINKNQVLLLEQIQKLKKEE